MLTRLLFQPPTSSYTVDGLPENAGELLLIPPTKREKDKGLNAHIPCAFFHTPSARYLFVHFHANAEDIGQISVGMRRFASVTEAHVLAVEYPGFGINEQPLGLGAADETMRTVMRYVVDTLKWPLDSVIVMGRSLGAAFACRAALEFKVAGLILIAPFRSVKTLLTHHIGGMAAYLFPDVLRNDNVLSSVNCKTLVIHGERDEVVPSAHAEELYNISGGTAKQLLVKKGMGHNGDVLGDGEVVIAIMQMFDIPDYCFTDIVVPPEHLRCPVPAPAPHQRLNLFDTCTHVKTEKDVDAEECALDGAATDPGSGSSTTDPGSTMTNDTNEVELAVNI
jgi:esterase/lipase